MKRKIMNTKKNLKSKKVQAIQNERLASPVESQKSNDIIDLILRDHKPIKELILILKDPEIKMQQKRPPYEEFETILLGHAEAEEQSLYVHMKNAEGLRLEAMEGDVEHGLAVQLIEEINQIKGDELAWLAKVKVLAELVSHHVKEEEKVFLKDVRKKIDVIDRIEIGNKYVQHLSQIKTDRKGNSKITNQIQPRVMHV